MTRATRLFGGVMLGVDVRKPVARLRDAAANASTPDVKGNSRNPSLTTAS